MREKRGEGAAATALLSARYIAPLSFFFFPSLLQLVPLLFQTPTQAFTGTRLLLTGVLLRQAATCRKTIDHTCMKRLRSDAVVKPTRYHYRKRFFFPLPRLTNLSRRRRKRCGDPPPKKKRRTKRKATKRRKNPAALARNYLRREGKKKKEKKEREQQQKQQPTHRKGLNGTRITN